MSHPFRAQRDNEKYRNREISRGKSIEIWKQM